jgi:hypothetical protein
MEKYPSDNAHDDIEYNHQQELPLASQITTTSEYDSYDDEVVYNDIEHNNHPQFVISYDSNVHNNNNNQNKNDEVYAWVMVEPVFEYHLYSPSQANDVSENDNPKRPVFTVEDKANPLWCVIKCIGAALCIPIFATYWCCSNIKYICKKICRCLYNFTLGPFFWVLDLIYYIFTYIVYLLYSYLLRPTYVFLIIPLFFLLNKYFFSPIKFFFGLICKCFIIIYVSTGDCLNFVGNHSCVLCWNYLVACHKFIYENILLPAGRCMYAVFINPFVIIGRSINAFFSAIGRSINEFFSAVGRSISVFFSAVGRAMYAVFINPFVIIGRSINAFFSAIGRSINEFFSAIGNAISDVFRSIYGR